MPSTSNSGHHRSHLGFGPVLLANLLPLIGVLQFGWDPRTLVVIYAIELFFTFPLAGVKALFAQYPSRTDHEKEGLVSVSNGLVEARGSVELVSWLPPIYLRNLPFATAIVTGIIWFLIAGAVVLSNIVSIGGVLTRPEVLLSGLALIVGQSVETWRDYFGGGYETASAYSVIETPARQAFFLTFVLAVTPGIGIAGVEVVLGIIVLVKLLVEWSAYRATVDGTGRLTGWLSGPDPTNADNDTVAVPESDFDASISTDSRAVLYTAVFDVGSRLAPFLFIPFVFVWFAVMSLLGDGASPVVANTITVAIATAFIGYLAAHVVMKYLQYSSLEYRRYEDQLVAYDTLVAEPQWSSPVSVFRDVQVVPDRFADRLLGTRTIVVTTGWGDAKKRRYLGPIADAERLVELFELPIATVELDPIDWRPIGLVVTCFFALGGTLVVLAVGPWVVLGELLLRGFAYVVFGIPIIGFMLRLLWIQAYPERTADPVTN